MEISHRRNRTITGADDGTEQASIETILHEYNLACQVYGCRNNINPGVLATIRFQLPFLRVSGSFFDGDMLALVEVLLRHINGSLSYIRRLDFSLAAKEGKHLGKKGIRSHGAYALSRVLQISMYIEEVFIPGNKIGPYGASAIFAAVKSNPTLRTLLMRGCCIREQGAFALVSQILMPESNGSVEGEGNTINKCGLREIDISANRIGFLGVFAIEKGLKRRTQVLLNDNNNNEAIHHLEIDLEGNMVFQEVMK